MAKRIRRPNGVTPIEWIERSLVPEGECRTWPHATNPRGYGFTSTGRKPGEQDLVHRIVWAGANGPIPSVSSSTTLATTVAALALTTFAW